VDPRTEKMLAEHRAAVDATPVVAPALSLGDKFVTTILKAHWAAAIVSGAALSAAGIFAVYLLVTVPGLKREQMAMELRARQLQESQAAAKQSALDACLVDAQSDFTTLWDAACAERKVLSGCSLPEEIISAHNQRRRDARAECLRVYSLESNHP
jgi:hypothetical protein